MALNIGELVGTIGLDDSGFGSGLDGAFDRFKEAGGKMKALALGVGAGAAAALGVGLAQNLEISAARGKLQAQFGLTGQQASLAGKVAGDVYAGNFGGSMTDVQDAIGAVGRDLVDLNTVGGPQLQDLTQRALGIADTFGVDVSEATRAAAKLMKNGLAPDAKTAFDLITKGFQNGLNSSDDFLDTLNEYSSDFKQLGITGPQALGYIQAGLKGGARDADTVADAFKEFGIRAIDGSKLTGDAFKALGFDAKAMAKTIADGGPAAGKATQQIIQSISKIKDPVKQNQIGVALFGTQWEDTVRKVLPNLATVKGGMTGVKGATDRMNAAAASTPQAKVEAFKRQIQGLLADATQLPGPFGSAGAAIQAFGVQGLVAVGALAQVGIAFRGVGGKAVAAAGRTVAAGATMAAGAAASAARTVASMVVMGAKWAWLGIRALAGAAKVALSWIIAMGPIALVIAAVIAIVVLIVKNWDKISAVTKRVWNAVVGFLKSVWNGIKNTVGSVWNWITSKISGAWNGIKNAVASAVNWVRSRISAGWSAVRSGASSAWNAVVRVVSSAWNQARSAVSRGISNVISFVRRLPGRIRSAIGNLGRLLWNAGRNVIQGLINGISSMIGRVGSAIGNIARTIRNYLPFSPAKTGPLAGAGNPMRSGRSIVRMLAQGMDSEAGTLDRAMGSLAGRVRAPGVRGQVGAHAGYPGVRGLAGGREGPLIGVVNVQPDQSPSVIAEKLYFLERTRG
ncbi:MAG: phage tail tape measure protein [Micromonosporaceae bacterium]